MDIGIHRVENLNNILLEMTKHVFPSYAFRNKELNALIEKKSQKIVKNKKRIKTEKKLQHFQEMQISDNESKKCVSRLAEDVEN